MKQNIKSFISQRIIILPILLVFFYGLGKGQDTINNAVLDSTKGKYTVSVENGDSVFRYIPKVWTLRPTSENSNNQGISKVNNVSRMSKVSAYSDGSMDLSHIPNSCSIDNTKDIGEITINQSGGNGSVGYSVPINAYQTPNGMSPSVQLAYNSMSGNGIAGYGWHLGGLSSISSTNSNMYFDGKTESAKSDGPFALDGKRLIFLYEETITVSVYQSETGNIKVKAIKDYNIVKYFRVYYPNGSTALFGFTTNTTAKASYPLTNITDANSNAIDYTYSESNNVYYLTEINYGGRKNYYSNQGVPNYAKIVLDYETRNDVSPFYLGGNYSGSFKLQQDKRLKEIKTYFNGNLLQNYSLTYKNATSSLLTEINCNANSRSLNPLKFYYGENNQVVNFTKSNVLLTSYFTNASAPNLILSKGKFDQYTNNDGLISYPYFSTYGETGYKKNWLGIIVGRQYGSKYPANQPLLVYANLPSGTSTPITLTTESGFLSLNAMDVDGDGKDELVKINTSSVSSTAETVTYKVYDVLTSIYTGSYTSLRYTFDVNYGGVVNWSDLYSPALKTVLTGDFLGKGKQTTLTMTYNKNIKNEDVQSWATLVDFDNKSKSTLFDKACFSLNPGDQVFVIDFDGDGKADICRKTSSATEIYTFDLSTGKLVKIAQYGSIDLSNKKMLLGDINGDGKTDIAVSPEQGSWISGSEIECGSCDYCVYGVGSGCQYPTYTDTTYQPGGNTWNVYYSTGSETAFELQTMTSASFESDDKLLLQDMNDDGKLDLVVNNNGMLKLYSNINGKFSATPETQTTSLTGGKDAFLVAGNVENGYRMSQLFSIYNYNLDAITFTRNLNTEQLLTGTITSTGIINKHQYSSILSNYSIYDRGTSCTYPYRNLGGNLFLLGSTDTYLSGALLSSASTKYTKGVLDIRGKGFVGFEKVETYDNLRNTTTTQNFNPLNFGVLTSVDGPTASASYQYNVSTATNKITTITLASKTENNKLTNASSNSTYTYDSYGNPTSELVNYGGGLTTTTTNLFDNYNLFDNDPINIYRLGVLYEENIVNKRNSLISTDKKTFSNSEIPSCLPRKVTIQRDGNQVSETTLIYQNGQLTNKSTKNYTASKNLETKYVYDTYGRLSKKTDPLGLYVDYAYDTYGRVASVTDHKTNKTEFGYDSWGRKNSTTSPDGVKETQTMQWVGAGSITPASPSGGSGTGGGTGQIYRDLQLSAPLTQSGSVTATNSIKLLTNFTYSAANSGSLILSIDKAANYSAPPTSISGSSTGGTGDYMYMVTKRTTGAPVSQSYIDALGREIRTGTMRFDGNYLYSDKTYDSYGRLDKVSLPFKGNSAVLWNTYSYDTNDILTGINYASGKTDSYSYSNLSVSATKDGITKTTTKDATGKVVSITDPAGVITYNLRADGQPSSIVAPGDVTTSFTYDIYGRQLTLVDPSSGTITYTYDARGNLNSETDARGKIINTNYDDYNRIVQKGIDGEFTTTYGYNTDGLLETVSSTNGTGKTMTYDNLMRLSSVKENAPDAKYLQKNFAYNAGNTTAISYTSHNGAIATENYSYTNGTMTETKLNNTNSIWKLTAENDLGLATASVTGNLLREYGYDAYGLPISRTAKYGTNVIQNFGYNFNSATGNLSWRKDNNRNLQEDFSYDNLNRLTGFGSTTIAYDTKGNITEHTGIGSYAYKNTAKPYAITSVTPYGTAIPLRYQDVTYNSMQRPATITENGYVATFSYDDGGDRVKMLLTHNGTTQLTRYYLGGQYEIDAEVGTERLYLGGDAYSASAVYLKEAGNWNIYYICRDYQGSITHIVDANGSLKQELSYDPWGRLRDPNTQQVYAIGAEPVLFLARGYTGHEHLTVFGLINMNARLYDPAVGRFLSPDPYVQSPDNSQNFNRYSYCLNNPLRYSDPTGMLTWNDVIAGVSFIAGIVLEFIPLGWTQALGTSLIVAGFSHFAGTINQIQSSNISWNEASNNVGFQFSTTIGFNHASAKEKRYSNGNTSAGNMNPNIEDYPDSRFFQGSDYDAAMLSKMLTEKDGDVEHPYRSTPNGFYFEQTSGYTYQGQNANGENIFTYAANSITHYNGYTKSVAHNYETEYREYFDAGTVMNRSRTIYRSHYHPWNASLSQDDIASTNTGYYPLYAIHGNEPIYFASNGMPYQTRRTIMDVYYGLFNMKNPWQSMK